MPLNRPAAVAVNVYGGRFAMPQGGINEVSPDIDCWAPAAAVVLGAGPALGGTAQASSAAGSWSAPAALPRGLERAATDGTFVVASPGFIAAGTKP